MVQTKKSFQKNLPPKAQGLQEQIREVWKSRPRIVDDSQIGAWPSTAESDGKNLVPQTPFREVFGKKDLV